jgi:MFS family permease
MLRTLRAGLMAASCQLAILLTLTLVISLFQPDNLIGQETGKFAPDEQTFCIHYLYLLIGSYLIFAIGFSFSESQSVSLSAQCFRRMKSRQEMEAVATQFGIPAILLVGIAFAPPDNILDIGHRFVGDCLTRLGWAAVMSICVAFCGASAHAAYKAKSQI